MGRDWYYWNSNSKSSKKAAATSQEKHKKYNANTTTSTSAAAATTAAISATTQPSGCLCPMFNLFDFHHFQSAPFTSNFDLPDDHPPSTITKGTEAPRNSLELDQPSSVTQSTTTVPEDLNIPVGIQIRTKKESVSSSVEISCSPGAKTPTLVARLMGLDLLPDKSLLSSPSSSSNQPTPCRNTNSILRHKYRPWQPHQTKPISQHRHSFEGDVTGTRSLPETPRISAARRSDVDHRFSLQINKENITASEEMVLSRLRKKVLMKNNDQEQHTRSGSSPSHYAKQIVKQFKESISKRSAGNVIPLVDITNTTRNRRDLELVNQLKHSSSSSACSLRLKKASAATSNSSQPNTAPNDQNVTQTPSTKPRQQLQKFPQLQKQKPIKHCKKIAEEKFSTATSVRLKRNGQTTSSNVMRNKQEEAFVRSTTAMRAGGIMRNPDHKKLCNKTSLSNDQLLNNISVPTLLPLNKDPVTPTVKLIQKQISNTEEESKQSSQLSRCLSHNSYTSETQQAAAQKLLNTQYTNTSNNNKSTRSITREEVKDYRDYITIILTSTGININNNNTPLLMSSFTSLDASIFYHLEKQNNIWGTAATALNYRCNRKLLFHLVDEIMSSYNNNNSTNMCNLVNYVGQLNGCQLLDMLVSKVTSFSGMDCKVLEDIDALIEKDWTQVKEQSQLGIGELRDGIVMEIEEEIFVSLINEVA